MAMSRKSKPKTISGFTPVRQVGLFDSMAHFKKEKPLSKSAHSMGKESHEKARTRRSFS